MKTAYLDCFSGISGDMFLGALVDSGIKTTGLRQELNKIPIKGYTITARKVLRCGISATKVDVLTKPPPRRKHAGTTWQDIKETIDSASLSHHVKQKGLEIFKILFEAEAEVHDQPFDRVHLHELGGVDCIVDIFGTVIGLDMLGVSRILTSPVNLGSGTVKTAHGTLPVPAPATLALLKGYPVYSFTAPFELTTPTGAALIRGLGASAAPIPTMAVDKIGYGAGRKDLTDMPNAVRLLVGEELSSVQMTEDPETVTVIETNIDDMSPQLYEDVMDKLFAAGALDVFLESVVMKKSRPAVKLTAIASNDRLDRLAEIIFRETTTIGVRFRRERRKTLTREIRTLRTEFGDIRVKVSRDGESVTNVAPEYDDLRALSAKHGVPIKTILRKIAKHLPES
ncbi:MAG: nickel pincer cofactor biosynthesis protein LarC [Chloroflexota bacterium]